MTPKLKKYWWLIAIILIIIGFGANQLIKTQTNKKKSSNIYTVKRQNVTDSLTLSGEVDAQQKANLRFAVSGKLVWVGIKEGDVVTKGQAIASLDAREVQKTLQKKLLDYQDTRWTFDQTKDDKQGQVITDSLKRILDKSQFDLTSSVLDVELQSLAVESATLISPISGIVTHIDSPEAGVNITPATALFDIVNPETIYLSVNADQSEVIGLTPQMKADLSFDAYPDKTYQGTIQSIGFVPKTGETGTVYEVKVNVPKDDNNPLFRIGMTADATFVIQEKNNVIAIPLVFIKSENNKQYVTRKNGNTKVKTYVVTGLESDNLVEITSGLSEGDIVYD